jgi:hypothetical protein
MKRFELVIRISVMAAILWALDVWTSSANTVKFLLKWKIVAINQDITSNSTALLSPTTCEPCVMQKCEQQDPLPNAGANLSTCQSLESLEIWHRATTSLGELEVIPQAVALCLTGV